MYTCNYFKLVHSPQVRHAHNIHLPRATGTSVHSAHGRSRYSSMCIYLTQDYEPCYMYMALLAMFVLLRSRATCTVVTWASVSRPSIGRPSGHKTRYLRNKRINDKFW